MKTRFTLALIIIAMLISITTPAASQRYTKKELAQHAAKYVDKCDVNYAVNIIWKESHGNTRMQNKRSTSHGLNGFLRSTWKSVSRAGIEWSLRIDTQIRALSYYVETRKDYRAGVKHEWAGWKSFKTAFQAAWAHHQKKGWY